ncbi:Uncharacterised protein family UPF0489 [Plasmopara halstedii]|uniref:Uncharacterized protein family UPF0489 n=1 Tax=Plasmopara halstedii TaxID=4781 RepID=A0A0N7L793_PLAHL|nr:Uncharacterised protein family UPF0489 [Plasmopara halstedii]CEG46435.1 Uncharacterised protein family UPF0489 [Plasmopara halstedii]|eukprot:XP_024582804.1 Uncharacterised protein family UPF0489 [Plasmopara halstedii]
MTTVVIVDDHHHCLPDIHLAIRQHCLPFSHIHVIHVDAHPDLSFSANIDTNVIFDPEKLYDTLDESIAGIAEFLLPLVFAGHVNQITWLKPSWATQMPCGAFQKLKVGRRNLNGAMGVTCGLPHFVEDELYCSVEEMNPSSTKAWDLFVTEMKSSFDDGATVATNAISTARTNTEAFILDIDLDYFSTWNPFRKGLEMHIDHAAMKIVTQVFTSVRYKVTPLDSMQPKQRDFERREFGLWMNRLEAADKMENASKRGNLNEPRLSYAAFLKLVRNRRSEFTTHKRRGSSRSQSGAKRRVLKEQLEIRALINELELIRHSLVKKSPKCNVIMSRSGNERTQIGLLHATIPNLSDTSSIIGDASTDGTVSAGDVSTTETYLPIMSKQGGSTDDVVVSRSKLNLMLQMAQETLEAQKKLLEEVLISFTGLWKLLAEYFWEDFRHKKEIEKSLAAYQLTDFIPCWTCYHQ